eukprot:gene11658-34368_t
MPFWHGLPVAASISFLLFVSVSFFFLQHIPSSPRHCHLQPLGPLVAEPRYQSTGVRSCDDLFGLLSDIFPDQKLQVSSLVLQQGDGAESLSSPYLFFPPLVANAGNLPKFMFSEEGDVYEDGSTAFGGGQEHLSEKVAAACEPGLHACWFAFFQVTHPGLGLSEIGAAISNDEGASWIQLGVVLSAPFSLTAPWVAWDTSSQQIVMIPGSRQQADNLTVYYTDAHSFPFGWHAHQIPSVENNILLSARAVHAEGRWRILLTSTIRPLEASCHSGFLSRSVWGLLGASNSENYRSSLYSASSLLGPWEQHPQNLTTPVGQQSTGAAQLMVIDGQLHRWAIEQKWPYQSSTQLIRMVDITETGFTEEAVARLVHSGTPTLFDLQQLDSLALSQPRISSVGLDNERQLSGSVGLDNQRQLSGSVGLDNQRQLSDSVGLDNQRQLSGSVGLDNQRQLSDSVGLDNQRQLSDSVGLDNQRQLSDSVGLDNQRQLSDSAGLDNQRQLSDSVRLDNQRQLSDSVGLDNQRQLSDSVGLDNQRQLSDSVGLDNQRQLSDSVGLDYQRQTSRQLQQFDQYSTQGEYQGQQLQQLPKPEANSWHQSLVSIKLFWLLIVLVLFVLNIYYLRHHHKVRPWIFYFFPTWSNRDPMILTPRVRGRLFSASGSLIPSQHPRWALNDIDHSETGLSLMIVVATLGTLAIFSCRPSLFYCPREYVRVDIMPSPPVTHVDLKAPFDVTHLVVVTGATAGFFDRTCNMIASLQYWEPRQHVIVYDLGYTKEQLAEMSCWRHYWEPRQHVIVYDLGYTKEQLAEMSCWRHVTVRRFRYEDYPDYVSDVRNYAFKALVMAEALKEFPAILWIDSGMELRAPMNRLRHEMRMHGHVSSMQDDLMGHPMYTKSHIMAEYILGKGWEKFRGWWNCAGGLQGFVRDSDADRLVLQQAVNCSLHKDECIAPEGADRTNFNFDQTAFSILIWENNYSCLPQATHCMWSVKKASPNPWLVSTPIEMISRGHRSPRPYSGYVRSWPGCRASLDSVKWTARPATAESLSRHGILHTLVYVYLQGGVDELVMCTHYWALALFVLQLLAVASGRMMPRLRHVWGEDKIRCAAGITTSMLLLMLAQVFFFWLTINIDVVEVLVNVRFALINGEEVLMNALCALIDHAEVLIKASCVQIDVVGVLVNVPLAQWGGAYGRFMWANRL